VSREKVTVSTLAKRKGDGARITMLTAYDCPFARFIDMAEIDIVLVSDALGTIALGRREAMSVTVDEMIYHTRACRNGTGSSLLVSTLPFGSYATTSEAVHNAMRLMKEGLAEAVHVEGSIGEVQAIAAIVDAGIPVMGHVGITKQKAIRSGVFRTQGRTAPEAAGILRDSQAMAAAGVFALVMECIPAPLAEAITQILPMPTIGIGAGIGCDGQALVTHDMLGLYKQLAPRFLKTYGDLEDVIVQALSTFRQDVLAGSFPTSDHSYSISDDELSQLVDQLDASTLGIR
jgi:3-methyl-2-oxobutanoate hydroxymethyltransferase